MNNTENSATPVPKVIAAGVAGSVTIIVVWVAGRAGIDVPAPVAAAFTTVLSFVAGYFAPRDAQT